MANTLLPFWEQSAIDDLAPGPNAELKDLVPAARTARTSRLDSNLALWDAGGVLDIETNDNPEIPSSEQQIAKKPCDEERQAALDRLSRHALEYGLYDRNEMPECGADE